MLTRRILLAGLGLPILTFSARGHHGFGGRYDRSAPVWLEGEVLGVYFGLPHAEVTIRSDSNAAPRTDAATDEFANGLVPWDGTDPVEVEFPPVRLFFALDGRVRTGDRVAVIALRNCEPPGQLRGQAIRPADGNWVVRTGRMQTEVAGC